MKIILASSSIGRRKVLESLGLKFEVIPANIDEEKFTASNPIKLIKKIAKAKALAVLKKLQGGVTRAGEPHGRGPELVSRWKGHGAGERQDPADHNNYLIIAADSMAVFQGKTFGKPKNRQEATRFLQIFSGKTHEFVTGLYVVNTKTKKTYQASAKTKVKFEKLTEKEIEDYVKTAPVTLFAGAYSLEETGAEILRPKIEFLGSKTNVLGLPVEKLVPILKKEGVSIRKFLQA